MKTTAKEQQLQASWARDCRTDLHNRDDLARLAEIEATQANGGLAERDRQWVEEVEAQKLSCSVPRMPTMAMIARRLDDALRATTAELEALRIEHARFAAVLAVENWKRGSAEPFGAVPVLERARNQAHAIDTVTYPEACREAREALRAKEGTR